MARPTAPPGTVNLLVVDEDPEVCALIQQIGEKEGLNVRVAHDLAGGEAQAGEVAKLHLLIADWVLPDGSGLDLAAAVRAIHEGTLIVLLGETGSLKLANELFSGGVQDFLRKPLPPPKDLTRRLRRAILAASREGQTSKEVTVMTSVLRPEGPAAPSGDDVVPTIIVSVPDSSKSAPPQPPVVEALKQPKSPPSAPSSPPPASDGSERSARRAAPGETQEETSASQTASQPDLSSSDAGAFEDAGPTRADPNANGSSSQGPWAPEAAASTPAVGKAEPREAPKTKGPPKPPPSLSAPPAPPLSAHEEEAPTLVGQRPDGLDLSPPSSSGADEGGAFASSTSPGQGPPLTVSPMEETTGAFSVPRSPALDAAFRMSFRSIPDFSGEGEPVAEGKAAPTPFEEEEEDDDIPFLEDDAALEAVDDPDNDDDFQVDVSEPTSTPPIPIPSVPEATGVFGRAGEVAVPPKAVRPGQPDGASKTWVVDTESTGLHSPELTQVVWTTKNPEYGTGAYFAYDPKQEEGDVYEVERELAHGSKSTVYLARWPGDEASVALKVLSTDLSRDVVFRQRFRREIRSHAALRHPNIVQVHKYGRRRGSYFMALEVMKGHLKDVLRTTPTLPTAVIAFILHDVVRGAHFAHRRGIIHRDLKPQNLMFSFDGVVKIGDFGVAKNALDPNKSTPGVKLGTPAYFSPEQARGDDLDARSDLFTLGTIIYEMVTGKNPYERGSDTDSMLAVTETAAPPLGEVVPEVHPFVAGLFRKLTAPRPEGRFRSGAEVLEVLDPMLQAVLRRYPEIRRQFVQSPPDVVPQLRADEARLEVKRAVRLLETDRSLAPRAGLAVQRALALEPGLEDALALHEELAAKHGFNTEALSGADIDPLIQRFQGDPSDVTAAQTLALKAREHGNMLEYLRYLRRYARLAPDDSRARFQLEGLLGDNPFAPFVKDKRQAAKTTSAEGAPQGG